MRSGEIEELRGEIVALETALAAAFGEIAVLRATVEGGGPAAALGAMEAMAAQLEGSVLRGVVGAESQGRPGAAAGFEKRMEQIAHALRNAIAFRAG
jgi:predicted exporter